MIQLYLENIHLNLINKELPSLTNLNLNLAT
jgi:hypothetical protein